MRENDRPNDDVTDSIYRAPASDTGTAIEGDLLGAYVGDRYAMYYAGIFSRFESGGSRMSWNWPAFFIASVWLLYRKMWLVAAAYWIGLPVVAMLVSAGLAAFADPLIAGLVYYAVYYGMTFVVVPIYANWLYYRHVRNRVSKVSAVTPTDQQAAELQRIGGTSNVAAVAVVVIGIGVAGILAAIAIPAYQDYTIRAQVSEGLNLAAGAKAAVVEFQQDAGQWPVDNAEAGLDEPAYIRGAYVSSVSVGNGNVVVEYGESANSVIKGSKLVLAPEGPHGETARWRCYSETIAPKHLPAACRP